MYYCCEVCGKNYSKEQNAAACEKYHNDERIKSEEGERQRTQMNDEIKKDYQSLVEKCEEYYNRYKVYPDSFITIRRIIL